MKKDYRRKRRKIDENIETINKDQFLLKTFLKLFL